MGLLISFLGNWLDPQSVDAYVGGEGVPKTLLKGGEVRDDVAILFKKRCHA